MLKKILALAVAAAMLGASGMTFALDRTTDSTTPHKVTKHKVAKHKVTKHKVKKAKSTAHKSREARSVRRVDDAPDFRTSQTRDQRMAEAQANWERTRR
jgi:uncharacterized low-complexity protein